MITSINEFRQYLKENGSSMDSLMDIISLRQELKDLQSRRRQLDVDMENEAGQMGDQWTDEDANRYGAEMNDLDEQIEAKRIELDEAEQAHYGNDEDDEKYYTGLQADIMNNIGYIKSYREQNPNATLDDEAREYKKAFNFNAHEREIKLALFQLDEDLEEAINKFNPRRKKHMFESVINKPIKAFTTVGNNVTVHYQDGTKEQITKSQFDEIIKNATKISLKDAFPGPIKTPYVGLVIKTNSGSWGVIIDVFERNGDYLIDLFLNNGEIMKNLSWNRDYKTAFGDKANGFSPFGDNGKPNQRHASEILPLINKAEDTLGINIEIAKSENLNESLQIINETSVNPLPFLVIGKTIDEANEIAIGYNAIVRETQTNGESLIVTQELRPNRYNVATENGVITKVLNIG